MYITSLPPRALSASLRYQVDETPEALASRIDWVDYAKGLLIVLVVYGHVIRGLHHAHIIAETGFVDSAIYSFHMAAFFWLSGLFLGSNTQIDFKDFYNKKLSKVLYPFLLWSLVQGTLSVGLAAITNSAKDLHRLFFFWLYPLDQFWFLHALILIQMLFFITKRLSWQSMLAVGMLFWLLGTYAGCQSAAQLHLRCRWLALYSI
jgi:fucose 4-O-acetylase-like acetyltransferase